MTDLDPTAVTPAAPAPRHSWFRDPRVVASFVSLLLVAGGLYYGSIPPGGGSPDIRELPGEANSIIQGLFGSARPESGYPRIRIDRAHIDLLLKTGDGKTPPVKYEAFTYPNADHLLNTSSPGGGNSYVYAHARTGMFWGLHDLHIGDIVVIDYGPGKPQLRYRVAELHTRVNWRDLSWLQPTSDDRLTLQTCNGWKDDDPRFIVVARRVADSTALNR
jgi:LPXTG-site transpeptidase (sortase) family protein